MMLLFTGFLFLFALAIALMPLGSSMKEKTMLITYCSGAGFWIGLIGTSFMVLIINQSCKASVRFNELYGDKKQFGIIHFFQNMEAKIMDVLMFVSLFTIIIAKVCNAELQLIYIILLMLLMIIIVLRTAISSKQTVLQLSRLLSITLMQLRL